MLTEYRLLDLKDDDPGLYKSLSKFGGTNATATLTSQGLGSKSLAHLYINRRDCASIHIYDETIDDIPEGEVAKHNDPHKRNGGWVIADGFVYDVTRKFGNPFAY